MDKLELKNDDSREPDLRSLFNESDRFVGNWREYSDKLMGGCSEAELIGYEHNICNGARPSYTDNNNLWYLPVETIRADKTVSAGMLKYVVVKYERVDRASGNIVSSENLLWNPKNEGTSVRINSSEEIVEACLKANDILSSTIANIIGSRGIENESERNSYLLMSLTDASWFLPGNVLADLQSRAKQIDKESGLTDHGERYVLQNLFLRVNPRVVGTVLEERFYTTCLRYRRIVAAWKEDGRTDYRQVECLKALYELETATTPSVRGLQFYRVSNIDFVNSGAFNDILEATGYCELMKEIDAVMEVEENRPIAPEISEHRAQEACTINGTEYRQPVISRSGAHPNISTSLMGIQARLSGSAGCLSTFRGKPARFKMNENGIRMTKLGIQFVYDSLIWAAAGNPIWRLFDVPKPGAASAVGENIVVNAMNMGLLGDAAIDWVFEQIVYGSVKISNKSRNCLFKLFAHDEDGVVIDGVTSPKLSNRFNVVHSNHRLYLAVTKDRLVEIQKRRASWHAIRLVRAVDEVNQLGRFKSGTDISNSAERMSCIDIVSVTS